MKTCSMTRFLVSKFWGSVSQDSGNVADNKVDWHTKEENYIRVNLKDF